MLIITWEWSLHLSLTIGVDSNPIQNSVPARLHCASGCDKNNGSKRYDNYSQRNRKSCKLLHEILTNLMHTTEEPPRKNVRMHELLSDSINFSHENSCWTRQTRWTNRVQFGSTTAVVKATGGQQYYPNKPNSVSVLAMLARNS